MKTFLIVLVVLVGAIVAGYYAMPDAEFMVEEPVSDEVVDEVRKELVPPRDGSYVLIPAESSMHWQGSRPLIEGYFDNGIVSLSSGSAVVASGSLTQASVTVDMNSIAVESTGNGQGESILARHLKSDDWFDAENFPEAVFLFTSYTEDEEGNRTVTGDLTIRDVTEELSFPVLVSDNDGRLFVQADEIEIDRTVWNIEFQSGSVLSNLGEKLVDDIFTLSFTAIFEKEVE